MGIHKTFAAIASDMGIPLDASDDTIDKFEQCGALQAAEEAATLLQQNGVADRLCILKSGHARFYKRRGETETLLADIDTPMTPLGISGLNSPGRYMSEIRLSAGSEYYSLDLSRFWDLLYVDPAFGAKLLSLLVGRATRLLWSARGLEEPPAPDAAAIAEGAAHSSDHDVLRRIGDAAFFAPLSDERLRELLEYCELRLYSKDETIALEGASSDGVYILFSGRVLASFTNARDGTPVRQTRTVVRPGVALSWHNGYSDLPAPYTIVATRDTSMLKISGENLRKLIAEDPLLAGALMQRQLWQLGRYQQTATGLSSYAVEDEAALMAALLQDNGARIPVQSVLHGVPHALRNRFTRGYALDCIYDAVISGNDAERSVAGLMIDTLDGVEREHRFFKQLNAVYARVADASPTANPVTLRELSNADFSRAFDQVPHVIRGMENLPDTPTNIFFYNHIAVAPENDLANGHAFSVDSHFISAKILLPKYGDGGQRIVRSSRNTEFWRNGYYSRLDNIYVHNQDSDWLDETPEEKQWRKEKLFIEAQKTFDAGRPLSIAPEGTSETPDSLTTTSPGPLKPGAFLLAGQLKPDPVMVPIALANFDYPVSRTTYAAVIKPPFRIRDFVEDIHDRDAMQKFLDEYREIFRGYVAEARQLAEEIYVAQPAGEEGLVTNVGYVSPVEEEFEADIRELEARILDQAQRSGKVVLYGSSTFRLWKDAARDLGIPGLMNLGFGGATLTSCRTYFKRVVLPHSPDVLIVYAGDNDIGSGASGREVAREFGLFMAEVAEHLPDTKCFVVSIKPSPFRTRFLGAILEANAQIRALTEGNPQWGYIDFNTPMLDSDGSPSPSFYDNDPLHVNLAGYGLLGKLVRDALSGL